MTAAAIAATALTMTAAAIAATALTMTAAALALFDEGKEEVRGEERKKEEKLRTFYIRYALFFVYCRFFHATSIFHFLLHPYASFMVNMTKVIS